MFRHLFFFLLTHFSVGLIFTILFVSLKEMGAFYFRLATGLACLLTLLALLVQPFGAVQISTLLSLPDFTLAQKLTCWFLMFSCVLLLVYNFLLPSFHKPILMMAFIGGAIAVAAYSITRVPADLSLLGRILLMTNGLGAAVILGSVLGAMITGHWYLVQHDLSLAPLKNTSGVFLGAVIFRTAVVILTLLFYRSSAQVTHPFALLTAMNFDSYLFIGRMLVGLVIPLVFGVMVWKATAIRSTQSATGILYATIVLILIGETFSKFLYFVSGNPL